MTTNYPETVSDLRRTFDSGKTRPLAWRKDQLKRLVKMFREKSHVFEASMKKDLGKPRQEAFLTEIKLCENVAINALGCIDSWVQDEPARKSLVTALDSCYYRYDPLGVALIIGPWNYPLQLTFTPLIGAIAAGNCAVVKPSEMAAATAEAIHDITPLYLDPDCFKIILGGVPETTDLLKVRFDYIFFTGSLNVAKIVAQAAARFMTPLTAELGGKSPVYIHPDLLRKDAKFKRAVKRIVWGKLLNAGQTCVAPDYVLCNGEVEKRFVEYAKALMEEFYSGDDEYGDLGRIINDKEFKRLQGLLDSVPDHKILLRGVRDVSKRLMGLHVLADVSEEDECLTSEIFGPVLPFLRVDSKEEAIRYINRHGKPLSLYVFSEDNTTHNYFLENTSSGGVCINDVIVHLSLDNLHFGGVGDSGYGHYHGKYTFETFSHKKSVLKRDLSYVSETLGQFRYPPYSDKKATFGCAVIRPLNFPDGIWIKHFLFAVTGAVISQALYYFLDTRE